MDLSISPDLEAYWCYLLVIAVGILVAYTRVSDSLSGFSNVYTQFRTWVLLSLYAATPVVLFWFLDRTNAIQDTSLFAGLLVGFGYERILAGTGSTLQTPENISQVWSPLLAFANRTAEKICARAYRKDLRMRRNLINRICGDDNTLKDFMRLAEDLTFDVEVFQESLEGIESDTSLSKDMKRIRLTELAYDEISAVEDYWFELCERGIIGKREYLWRAYEGASKLATTLVLVIILGAVYLISDRFSLGALEQSYAVWRLEKQNTTVTDRERTRERIAYILRDQNVAPAMLASLGHVLRKKETAEANVNLITNVLLANRCTLEPESSFIARTITDALLTSNADNRARIHRTLLYLAKDPPEILKQWDPGAGDSIVQLHGWVDTWKAYWQDNPMSSSLSATCL